MEKPWHTMTDAERHAAQAAQRKIDSAPADFRAFRELLAEKRKRPPSFSSDPDVIRGEALARKVGWSQVAKLTRDSTGDSILIKEIGHPAGREGGGGSAPEVAFDLLPRVPGPLPRQIPR